MSRAYDIYGHKQKYRQIIGAKESEGKKPHKRPNCMQKFINLCFKETGWDSADWINLAQDRDKLRPVVKRVIKIHVP